MKKDNNLAEKIIEVEIVKPISNQEKIILLINKCNMIRKSRNITSSK